MKNTPQDYRKWELEVINQYIEKYRETIPPAGANWPRDVSDVWELLSNSFWKPETDVSWLMDQCNVNTNKFYSEFKKCTCNSPLKQRDFYRAGVYKFLKKDDRLSKEAICLGLGFSNMETFRRFLRRI